MTDKQREREADFERELGALLRDQVSAVPEDVGQRLAAARRAAVGQVPESQPFRRGWWAGGLAAGVTAAALALAVSSSWQTGDELPAIPLGSEPEIAVMQDMELLEALEFLAWLEEEDAGAG